MKVGQVVFIQHHVPGFFIGERVKITGHVKCYAAGIRHNIAHIYTPAGKPLNGAVPEACVPPEMLTTENPTPDAWQPV